MFVKPSLDLELKTCIGHLGAWANGQSWKIGKESEGKRFERGRREREWGALEGRLRAMTRRKKWGWRSRDAFVASNGRTKVDHRGLFLRFAQIPTEQENEIARD